MISVSDLITAGITGIFAGICSAIGGYIANKSFLNHLEKLEKKLMKKEEVKL